MAMTGIVNEVELRKAIQQIHPDGELFEVRIISGDKRKKPASGYFKDADTLLEAFKTYDLRGTNVYFTINQIDNALFSRQQSEHFVAGANSTQDGEVIGYKWLFVDLDPERPTGISSSDDELQSAFDLAKKVNKYLRDIGFSDPVKAVSGNGAHLLYRINLLNTEENEELIKNCLKALSMLFDTDAIKVDTGNFNPSRVCKLYGTLAQKGSSTKERPYRMSRIIGEAKEVSVTDKVYLEKLAAELPAEEKQKPSVYNNYKPSEFDIEEWMNRYGLRYKEAPYMGGTKYILDECPFDSNHKAPDSMITKSASGAIGFKCLHNHCQGYHWKDLRLKFEPNAYEYNDVDRRIEEGWREHNRNKSKADAAPAYQKEDDLPVYQTAKMILDRVDPTPEYIKSGINVIDKQLCGLEKGRLSIISGLRASGKSTLLGELMLNAIDAGHTVVAYSGELTDTSFMNWIYLQAAGKNFVKKSAKYERMFYVEKPIKERIAEWLGDRLWLYNNVKTNKSGFVLKSIREKCIEAKADMVIIDNLMALDIQEFNSANEFNAQTQFLWALKGVAQDCHCHVILVAHPRKSVGFLRLEDVSGSNNIVNIIDNAFIVHRNNVDFKDRSEKLLKSLAQDWMIKSDSKVTNVVEIAKDREYGTCDIFVPLYYEPSSKRLKNYEAEYTVYGWDDEFVPLPELEEIPFGGEEPC